MLRFRTQSTVSKPVVSSSCPIVAVGGADIEPSDLNIFPTQTPLYVAADGGANHLLAAGLRPAAVIGDLDSLSSTARAAFGAILHYVVEQDTTDFEKLLTRVDAPLIVALGFLGGRFDHSFAVFNVLARFPSRRVLLVGQEDFCFLARQGTSRIALPDGCRVALIPLGPARVSTEGLRWDLSDAPLSLTDQISTSNMANGPVSFDIKGPVLLVVGREGLAAGLDAVRGQ